MAGAGSCESVVRALVLGLGLATVAAPAVAGCRLALALGFDVSNSVDDADYTVQRAGIIAALQDEEIRRAFLAPDDKVALAIFEWGGRRYQDLVLDWRMIETEDDLEAVIATMEDHVRLPIWQPTAIGAALDYALDLFDDAPVCAARTLDLSGDGRNNDWLTPTRVYEREDFGTMLVNGLAIGGHETDVVLYYRQSVVRGPGAFVEVAPTHLDFPRAIRRKLERELTGPMLGGLIVTGEEEG